MINAAFPLFPGGGKINDAWDGMGMVMGNGAAYPHPLDCLAAL